MSTNLDNGWPKKMPRYVIERPMDLLDKEIDYRVNVLGNLFLERGTYGTVLGLSGIGKSTVVIQTAIEAACGRNVFGIKVDGPLRVLVVQAEDSVNDRKLQVTGIINGLQLTEEERKLVDANFRIISPERRADRGQALFDYLRSVLKDVKIDLIILNPAFSFVEGSMTNAESVGDFLRNHLQEFCRDKHCAGLVIHHLPKPPKSGKGQRGADTTAYSAFGSAEWTNAPRASITIDRTMAAWVFEFVIGKRGSQSGWRPARNGEYRRYFVHSRSDLMFWAPASDADIAAANNGIGEEDFSEVFKGDADLDLGTIEKRFKHYGYNFEGEELTDLLANLVERGKLATTVHEGGEMDGMQTWRAVKSGQAKETMETRKEAALFFIEGSMPKGIITTELRKVVPYGNSVLSEVLEALVNEGKVGKQSEGANTVRYFLKEPSK